MPKLQIKFLSHTQERDYEMIIAEVCSHWFLYFLILETLKACQKQIYKSFIEFCVQESYI
jgi:hypothetical protein